MALTHESGSQVNGQNMGGAHVLFITTRHLHRDYFFHGD